LPIDEAFTLTEGGASGQDNRKEASRQASQDTHSRSIEYVPSNALENTIERVLFGVKPNRRIIDLVQFVGVREQVQDFLF
jgi:hypothetical protein